MLRVHTGDSDGVSFGANSADPITFYNSGAVPQRANPLQGPIVPAAAGQVVTYQQSLSPVSVATISAAEQSLTVGTTVGLGLLTTDFVAAVNKPTTDAGAGVHTGRISAANTLQLTFSNPTAAAVTPTGSQVYNVTVLRNYPVHSQTLTPAAVPANTTQEQVFNLIPVSAAGTAIINSAGQVTGVSVTAAGSNYVVPPTVVFNYGLTTPQVPSPNQTTAAPGIGASGIPIMSSGTVVGVQITNPGQGYTVAPAVTFLGGNSIANGMGLMVNKPTAQTGLAIGGCRIIGNNQIGITYVNPTAAAITPTSEAYSIVGLHSLSSINHVTSYGVIGTGLVSVAGSTSAEQTLTVNGLLATDIAMSASKPTLSAGIGIGNARVSAANTLALTFINATGAAVTPSATEIYLVTAMTQTPSPAFSVLRALLSPTSVAAKTTAEQTFTVTGLPYVNSSPGTVFVNKPSFQAGLAIAGCRISAANTLAITFENVTSSAIVPTAELYTIGCFNAVGPVSGGWVAMATRPSYNGLVNMVNELQQALTEAGLGLLKGAA